MLLGEGLSSFEQPLGVMKYRLIWLLMCHHALWAQSSRCLYTGLLHSTTTPGTKAALSLHPVLRGEVLPWDLRKVQDKWLKFFVP